MHVCYAICRVDAWNQMLKRHVHHTSHTLSLSLSLRYVEVFTLVCALLLLLLLRLVLALHFANAFSQSGRPFILQGVHYYSLHFIINPVHTRAHHIYLTYKPFRLQPSILRPTISLYNHNFGMHPSLVLHFVVSSWFKSRSYSLSTLFFLLVNKSINPLISFSCQLGMSSNNPLKNMRTTIVRREYNHSSNNEVTQVWKVFYAQRRLKAP